MRYAYADMHYLRWNLVLTYKFFFVYNTIVSYPILQTEEFLLIAF